MKDEIPEIKALGWLPGEEADVETVVRLGRKWGYGNLISHLQRAWSLDLRNDYDATKRAADEAAGIICVWCKVDRRTGRKARP